MKALKRKFSALVIIQQRSKKEKQANRLHYEANLLIRKGKHTEAKALIEKAEGIIKSIH